MTHQTTTLARKQRGEGIGGIVAMIILCVMFVKLGLAIIPAQLDDRNLTKLMGEKLKHANDNKKDVTVLFREFNKQANINGLGEFRATDIFQVTKKTIGKIQIEKKYVRESPLFPGVFVTNKFEGKVKEAAPEE